MKFAKDGVYGKEDKNKIFVEHHLKTEHIHSKNMLFFMKGEYKWKGLEKQVKNIYKSAKHVLNQK